MKLDVQNRGLDSSLTSAQETGGACAHIGEADVEAELGRGQAGVAGQADVRGQVLQCLYRRESTKRWGMTIMRDQCMDKKRSIRLEVFRGRKLLLESRNQEGSVIVP